jgi:glycerate 2-kinase
VKLIAAPDKLRGTATAREAASAIARGALQAGWACDEVPMADGGEGTLEAFGGANRWSVVAGPLGHPVVAGWRQDATTAVVEMAQASGLALVVSNDPVAASTRGTGQLIATALESGCTRVIVGVGGSATTDGGLGAVEALEPIDRLSGVELVVAYDVAVSFLDAARRFGPQKGATPGEVELLSARLAGLADDYRHRFGVDVRRVPGAGAAGGLAGGLLCVGARLVPGFEVIAAELGLPARSVGADLLVTAEGHLDRASFDGKVVGGVAALGASRGVPVVAIVGERDAGVEVPAGLAVLSLTERFGQRRARSDTLGAIEELMAEHLDGAEAPSDPGKR